ncbi:hypothetical protein ABBQ32_005569 [Trebouxia sp. C0010 RCD-2024]
MGRRAGGKLALWFVPRGEIPAHRPERTADCNSPAQQHTFLDLPADMIEEILLRLPFTEAIALGSTCHKLYQLLQPLRPAKLEQYLESDELQPDMQMAPVEYDVAAGIVQLYLSWTAHASRTLFHLLEVEKIPPDDLWEAIVPQIVVQGPKEYLSVCCSFGCLDWVSRSITSTQGQLFLFQHLANSDLKRLDRTFSGLHEMFLAQGIQEKRVYVHLCKNEPDIARQQDATLLLYWKDKTLQTKQNSSIPG